jgi:adenylate cyclase
MRQAQRKDPHKLDAWDRMMRAHWHARRFTREDLAKARRLSEEAIALDPTSAMAYADLAFARHFEAVFGWGDGPAESHARLGEAARKAVAVDDGDAMAHTGLQHLDEAIRLSPRSPLLVLWYRTWRLHAQRWMTFCGGCRA